MSQVTRGPKFAGKSGWVAASDWTCVMRALIWFDCGAAGMARGDGDQLIARRCCSLSANRSTNARTFAGR
jgi:hypothetical protein